MANILSRFFREYICGCSIVLIIIGIIVFCIGLIGIFMPDVIFGSAGASGSLVNWSPYIFIVGLIVLLAGVYYLYVYEKNKRFIIQELETKRRSEFIKKHQECKNAVRFLPCKYQEMLKNKERELKIK